MSKNYELLKQTNSDEDLYPTFGSPVGLSRTGDINSSLAKREQAQDGSLRSNPPRIQRLDPAEEKARSWERLTRERNPHCWTDSRAASREEEIKLVQRVFFDVGSPRRQVVLFASAESFAGSDLITARTSEVLAGQAEGPVCLVDANFCSSSLHQYFGIDDSGGFSRAVQSSAPIQHFARHIPDRNLWVMANRSRAARVTLPPLSHRVNQRFAELRKTFQYVIIHGPPLNQSSDAILLSRWSDGVVLVVGADSTRRDTARQVKEDLKAANVRLLGLVLSNGSCPQPRGARRWL